MRRIRDMSDEENEENMDMEMQRELNHLRAKYVALQKEKNSLKIYNDAYTRINESEINSLLAEQNHIMTDLHLATCSSNLTRDTSNCVKLESRLLNKVNVADCIRRERALLKERNAQIHDWEERVKNQREASAKIKFQNERQLSAAVFEKRQSVLESRLHLHITKFNATLAKNEKIRDCLLTLKNEKRKFLVRFKALSQRHKANHAQITKILDRSINMYEQTEEIKNKQEILLDKCEKDRWQRESDMKELELSIAEIQRSTRFMQEKANQRSDQLNERMERERLLMDQSLMEQTQKLNRLEEAWKRVTDLILESEHTAQTKGEIVEIILDKFKLLEEGHFAVYNDVNFQTDAVARLQFQLADVRRQLPNPNKPVNEVAEMSMSGAESDTLLKDVSNEHADSELQLIKFDQEQLDEEYEEAVADIRESVKQMESLMSTVPGVFDKLQAGTKNPAIPVTHNNDLNPEEISRLLAAIEEQANNLILTVFHNQQDYTKMFRRFAHSQIPSDDMVKIHDLEINVPSSMDMRSLRVYTTCKGNDMDGHQVSIDVDDLLEDIDWPVQGAELQDLVEEHMVLKKRILLESRKSRRSTIFGQTKDYSGNRKSIARATIHNPMS